MITDTIPIPAETVLRPGYNPFSEMVILDYYDGPVAGVVETEIGPYRFEMLAWDDRQDVRVFSLAPLPAECFQDFVKTQANVGSPHWPDWVVNFPADEAEAEAFEKEITRILGAVLSPQWVVAWHDLERKGLLAVKSLGPDESRKLLDENERDYMDGLFSGEPAGHGWFTLLGLSR